MEEENIVIGRKDFVPVLKGFAPIVAIYMNEETEIIVVPSENVKQAMTKEESDKMFNDIFIGLAQENGELRK